MLTTVEEYFIGAAIAHIYSRKIGCWTVSCGSDAKIRRTNKAREWIAGLFFMSYRTYVSARKVLPKAWPRP